MSRKRENFVRLAEARMSKALKDIQLIGNLSNTAAYEFSDSDVRKMFSALQKSLDTAKTRFSQSKSSKKYDFTIDE